MAMERIPKWRTPSIALGAIAVWSVLASSALADEVHVLPGSPAGQQYSVPLDQARHQGAGNPDFNANPGSGDFAPRFGQGIAPASTGANGGSDHTGADTSLASLGDSADEGGSGMAIWLIVGGAALVCLLGGVVGRRLSGRPAH